MMNHSMRELLERVERGSATPEEFAALDDALASESQRAVSDRVRALPHDTPSLEWRSQLNERMRKEAPKASRSGFARTMWGLGVAASVALAWVASTWNQAPQAIAEPVPSLEASLISTHRDTVRTAEIAGVGVSPHDLAAAHGPAPSSPYDWNELDLETL